MGSMKKNEDFDDYTAPFYFLYFGAIGSAVFTWGKMESLPECAGKVTLIGKSRIQCHLTDGLVCHR